MSLVTTKACQLLVACCVLHATSAAARPKGSLRARSAAGQQDNETATEAGSVEKIHLEIYYETLCPFCEDLLDKSFRKIWNDKGFRQCLDLELVPFGNAMVVPEARISTGYHFWHPDAKYPVIVCQHHEPECLGNQIQVCVAQNETKEKFVDLVLCMAAGSNKGHGIEMTSYDCMQELKIDPKKVKECVGSPANLEKMSELGERSIRKELNRSYVPWVMANGKHVDLDDDHDLLTPLCGMLPADSRPVVCKEANATKLKAAGAVNLIAGGKEVFKQEQAREEQANVGNLRQHAPWGHAGRPHSPAVSNVALKEV